MSWFALLVVVAALVVVGILYYVIEAVRLGRGANEPDEAARQPNVQSG
jgi:hypothetical protein